MMSLTPYNASPERLEEDASDVRTNLDLEFISMNGEGSENGVESENMPIYVRVRAMLPDEVLKGYQECFEVLGDDVIRSVIPTSYEKKYGQEPTAQQFTFSQAFGPSVHQSDIFENTMRKSVQYFIEGQNCLVFAYGNSGSGKTYTMHGTLSEPGIIPLTLQLLFDGIRNKQVEKPCLKPLKSCEIMEVDQSIYETDVVMKNSLLALAEQDEYDRTLGQTSMGNTFERSSSLHCLPVLEPSESMMQLCNQSIIMQGTMHYSVWCSFVEIYNEKIYDLLQPVMKKRKRLVLGTDSKGNTYVKDAKEISVQSVDEVLKLLAVGRKNLKIASTKLNYQSSRSHSIFTIKLVRLPDQQNPTQVGINLLSFCDLAGSERHCKTQNVGDRLKEAGNINTSLMVLGRCLEALRCNQTQREKKVVVPFRESQLTRLFADFFCGKGRASMIVNISPSSYTFNETLNVLKFSALAKQIVSAEMKQGNETMNATCTTTVQRLVNRWPRLSIKGDLSNASISSFQDISCEDLDATDVHLREIEDRDKLITELIALANDLEKKFEREKKEKIEIEEKTRIKLKAAYEEIMERREKILSKELNRYKDLCNLNSETRWHQLCQDIRKASAFSETESEGTDEDSDSEDDCNNQPAGANEKEISVGKNVSTDCSPQHDVRNMGTKCDGTEGKHESEKINSEKVEELSAKLSEFSAKLNEALEEKMKFSERCDELQSQLEKAHEEKKLKEIQVNDLCEKLAEMELDIIGLQTFVKEKEETVCFKETEINQLNHEIAKMKVDNEKYSAKLSTFEIQLREEKFKHMEDNRTYSEEIETLKSRIERLEGIVKIKSEELSTKEKELQTAATRDACKTLKIEDLQNTASHLQEKLIGMELSLKKAADAEKSYNHEINEEKVKSSKLAEKLHSVEQELDKEKAKCLSLENENAEMLAKINGLTEKMDDDIAVLPSSSENFPVTSDKVLALMRETDVMKRRIEKQYSKNSPTRHSSANELQQTHSLRERDVIDPAWKAALIPKTRMKSLPWDSKLKASDEKEINKEQLFEILNTSQYAEMMHFNCMVDLNSKNEALRKELLKVSLAFQDMVKEKEKSKKTDVAVEVDINTTVYYESVMDAFEAAKKEIQSLYPCEHDAHFAETIIVDGFFNKATTDLLQNIHMIRCMALQRIRTLLTEVEEKKEEVAKLIKKEKEHLNVCDELEKELSHVKVMLSKAEENKEKEIAALKKESNATFKALTSHPRVVVKKVNLDSINIKKKPAQVPSNEENHVTELIKSSSAPVEEERNNLQENRVPSLEQGKIIDSKNDKAMSSEEDKVVTSEQDEIIIIEDDEDFVVPPSPVLKPPPQNKGRNTKTRVTATDKASKPGTSNRGRPRKTVKTKDTISIVSEEPKELPKTTEEPKTRSGRSLRPRKGASSVEAAAPAVTRASNKRKVQIKETVQQPPTSPLERVKNFVSGATSRIKAATASYLSPLRTPAETPESTPVLTKRRKKVLYHPEAEPVLDVSPPPEEKTPACDAKKTQSELIKQINVRRQRR